jgi:hypothetical protein
MADEKSDEQIVAERSADIDATTANEHRKVFVLPPGPKPTEANGFDHRANYAATRQYAVQNGLRPTGDVRLVSVKPFGPGGVSWALTYAVPAVPAESLGFDDEGNAPVDEAEVVVITDNEADAEGHVPTNTEGNGSTPSTEDKPTA